MKRRNVETSKRQNDSSPQTAANRAALDFDRPTVRRARICSFRRFDVSSFAFRRRRSYTLIELLLVCAILGIASALLIPNLVGRDIMACQAAVRLIIGDLSFAQSDALSHQEYRRVHFNDDGSGYSLSRVTQAQLDDTFDPDTADYITDPLVGGQYIVNIGTDNRFAGVTISAVSVDGGRDLQYDALGGIVAGNGAVGAGGTITVTSANDEYVISIAPFTGKLTVTQQ